MRATMFIFIAISAIIFILCCSTLIPLSSLLHSFYTLNKACHLSTNPHNHLYFATIRYVEKFIEIELLSDLVADYEEIHDPIKTPSLIDIIKLRMHERGLNQKKLSELLN